MQFPGLFLIIVIFNEDANVTKWFSEGFSNDLNLKRDWCQIDMLKKLPPAASYIAANDCNSTVIFQSLSPQSFSSDLIEKFYNPLRKSH